ncbi:MAG: ATP-binding protein [Verrucomicrobiaceae bacterium]|nr:MAG: ATP-binding protein [Verrucomicrobiaceae bacterium]
MEEKIADVPPPELEILSQIASFELGLTGGESLFDSPSAEYALLLPGCADLQAASIERMGYRGKFPKPAEWENLLSMLEPGQELLWIISKRGDTGFFYHLVLKGDGQPQGHSGRTVELRSVFRSMLGQFTKRSFPESKAEAYTEEKTMDLLEGIFQHAKSEVVVTSGQPSPSILEDNRDFPEPNENATPDASLNDIVEPFAEEDTFSVVFTVGRAEPDAANAQLERMTDLRTALSPFLKIQHGQSVSDATAKNEGTQIGTGLSVGQAEARGLLPKLFQGIFGANADKVLQSRSPIGEDNEPLQIQDQLETGVMKKFHSWYRAVQGKYAKLPIAHDLSRLTDGFGDAARSGQRSSNATDIFGITETHQKGTSRNITSSDAMLELIDQKLQEGIRSLKKATGTGAFFLGAEIFSPKTELSLRIARTIAGTLAGARTHARPFQTAIYRGPGFADHLTKACTIEQSYPSITIQSRHIAALFLPVPEADLPGLKTKRNVFYGKPNPSKPKQSQDQSKEMQADSKDTVTLGELAHLKSGFNSRGIIGPSQTDCNAEFRIPACDLTSHLLIAGTTGSGKTQRSVTLLNALPRDRFQVIVIESAKKTYRRLLQRENTPPQILALGVSGPNALRINPFYFEHGTSLKRHISIFSDALADLLPVEALIGPKLREAIQSCYTRYEWDIETGLFRGTGTPTYPGMADLHMEAIAVADALRYGPELNSNYKGALLGRTKLFIDELYQDIFGWGGNSSLDEMFGGNDIILEMDALPPSEAKMPSFVLSLLLERMRSWQQRAKDRRQQKRDLIIVIEEAHNLLEKALEKQQSDREMGSGGFLLKQIVRLLQEGREAGLGIMVVDQSPASLADAVIRNTNTKIILRITDSEEAERIGTTLGLTKEECRDLHELEDGEAVVKVKNAGKALKLCRAPLVKEYETKRGWGSQAKGSAPDYYLAARAIREINNLGGSDIAARTESLLSSLNVILAAAGENVELKRFFIQKLFATLAETHSGPESESSNHQVKGSAYSRAYAPTITEIPAVGEIALLVASMLRWSEVAWFTQQLTCILEGISWENANKCFELNSLPLLPLVKDYLQSSIHWAVMDAAAYFTGYLEQAAGLSNSDPVRENAYSDLLTMVAGAPPNPRFEVLRKLLHLFSR